MKKASAVSEAATLQARCRRRSLRAYMQRNWMLYLMILPGMLALIIFKYVPMYGVLMAFQKYSPSKGILGVIGLDSNILSLSLILRILAD